MGRKENVEASHDRMVLVANLYYKNKLSQAEIAARLGVSRPWVSRLLTRAEEEGIVSIRIESPAAGIPQLEKQLQETYHLDYAGVISTDDASRDFIAIAAANYFVSQAKPRDVIGIGWGDAISRFIRALPVLQWPEVQTVPLAGSFGVSPETLPNYAAMQMAETLGGTATPLHAPAFCSSSAEREALLSGESTRTVLQKAEASDIAVMGIGSFTSSSFLLRHHILSAEEQTSLSFSGAVGDMVLQFFDAEGRPIDNDVCRRIIHADLYRVRANARSVIGIAHGTEKLSIIEAALKSHLLTAFFTDSDTARRLLERR